MCRIALAAIVACALATPALAARPAVTIEQGALAGTTEDDAAVFKGIPFAAPPVGRLRWRAPQAAPTWPGTRDAGDFGSICPQARSKGIFSESRPQSEDCLTINVWTPHLRPAAKLPVMVWIYGGAFQQGSSANNFTDGTDLARHGVIFVSFNYRLGVLGFFAHHGLEAENPDEPIGNYALMDQIAALRWVQKNITAFGGDPGNVTIFGGSAGGMSVNNLMASPMARGLFAKAISESGLGLEAMVPLVQAEAAGKALADRMGATGDDKDVIAKLRSLSTDDILADQAKNSPLGHFAPFVDGKVITEEVSLSFAKGEIAKVPYIAGSTSDEASLAPVIGVKPESLLTLFGDQLPTVRAIYEQNRKLTDQEFARQVFNDAYFASGVQALVGFVANTGAPARAYQFAYVANAFRGKVVGVGHGGEGIFVFGLRDFDVLGVETTDQDRAIIAMMQDYWTNFAKTGDPNGANLPTWPDFTTASQQTLVVDDKIDTVLDFRRAQEGVMIDAWKKRVALPAPK
jgi:para-nitrobenzyl esterase